MTSSDEIDRLLHYMPLIVRSSCVTDWEREFAKSIIGQNRRGNFRPSGKQSAIMSRLVTKFQEETMRDDDAPVIEEPMP